uniref:Uncharacterized protein n=1 Tax=Anguilla anguilla TaxID=7936 RepID=A0A0E9QXF7_ANGAN
MKGASAVSVTPLSSSDGLSTISKGDFHLFKKSIRIIE